MSYISLTALKKIEPQPKKPANNNIDNQARNVSKEAIKFTIQALREFKK